MEASRPLRGGTQGRCAEVLLRPMARRQHVVWTGATVREGVEAWRDAGVRDLIIVPSSATGNQIKALEEVFAAFG